MAAAIALRPVKLPACEALLADDTPRPDELAEFVTAAPDWHVGD